MTKDRLTSLNLGRHVDFVVQRNFYYDYIMYSPTARVFVWDFFKLRIYFLISCHLLRRIAVVNGAWIACNLPDRSSETKVSMKPGEKSKSKTSSTVSRENLIPLKTATEYNYSMLSYIYTLYMDHIIYNIIQFIYYRYIQITLNPIICCICIKNIPQWYIYPYRLIGRSPQTPKPQHTFTFRRFQTPSAPHGRWRRGTQRRCLGDVADAQGVGEKTQGQGEGQLCRSIFQCDWAPLKEWLLYDVVVVAVLVLFGNNVWFLICSYQDRSSTFVYWYDSWEELMEWIWIMLWLVLVQVI